jgi:O-antigen/teichoic acid export membrane protein
MRRSFKRLKQVFYLSVVGGVGLLACADPIFKLWMGDSVKIPLSIAIAVFVYSNLMSWLTICIFPINGIGKVKLQFYSSILELILIGPIAIVLAHYFSTPGIILAPILVSLPRAIWAPVQLNKLIARRASGIWFK